MKITITAVLNMKKKLHRDRLQRWTKAFNARETVRIYGKHYTITSIESESLVYGNAVTIHFIRV